jgi:molybdopterin-containing oxidoreductase family iron-sulfur binding subunit
MNSKEEPSILFQQPAAIATLANSNAFVSGLQKVNLSVSFSLKEDETAEKTTIAAPVIYMVNII